MNRTSLVDLREQEEQITCLTCYDYLTARVLDQIEELDLLLVGDSLGTVIRGEDDTLSVTLDDMIYHAKAVSNGVQTTALVVDLPFLEIARDRDRLVTGVRSILASTAAQGIKIEGAGDRLEAIEFLIENDVPVMGHLGLTPQSIHSMGGYRVQGTSRDQVVRLGRRARRLEEAGVFSLVLECVPAPVARELSTVLSIPVIGIGAGVGCDGQVLVLQDMLGLTESVPRFVRRYDRWEDRLRDAASEYCADVRSGEFPAAGESYELPDDLAGEDLHDLLAG